jgi:hypothetical protein
LNYPQTDKVWFAKAQWIPERAEFSLDPEQRDVDELLGKDPYRSLFACGCCLVAPADVFRSEGLLDERYFAFFDEASGVFGYDARVSNRTLFLLRWFITKDPNLRRAQSPVTDDAE